MVKQKTINSNKKMISTRPLAELVYVQAIKEDIERRITSKYLKRINYLIGANNQLMKELEQWERVGKRLEKATNDVPLSPEEAQIVRMPWLEEHHEK